MWMMGYNADGGEFNINMAAADSFNSGRKLRPLIPRPLSACSSADVFSLNHHPGGTMGEQNKREEAVVSSSRWNPTLEQLRVLEDLYRRGTRTPSADQIQQITAQLRRFGKIEGKNVFYWFQNHKARERQKRRRQLESEHIHHQQPNHNLDTKDAGASRRGYEIEEGSKSWLSSSQTELEPVSRGSRATKQAAIAPETRWVHLMHGEDSLFQDRINFNGGRNGAWQQMIQLPPLVPFASTNNLMNTTSSTTLTIPISSAAAASKMFPSKTAMDSKQPTLFEKEHQHCPLNTGQAHDDDQTLELFPLRTHSGDIVINQKDTEKISAEEGMNGSSCFTTNGYHFYEFLPLKK